MPAPKSVITAGAALIRARKTAKKLDQEIDAAIAAIGAATDDMIASHGMKEMQAGGALVKLRKAQTALGLVMGAHNDLRGEIKASGIDEPTDAEITAAVGIASIR